MPTRGGVVDSVLSSAKLHNSLSCLVVSFAGQILTQTLSHFINNFYWELTSWEVDLVGVDLVGVDFVELFFLGRA